MIIPSPNRRFNASNRQIDHSRKILILLFWLLIWQGAAWLLDNDILLTGPWEVGKALLAFFPQREFWLSVITSFGKISIGFLTAFFSGILMGWLAFSFPLLGEILAPLTAFMKSVPVASFVILALIWMGSAHLSILITFLVVFPVIYVNTTAGLKSTDKELLEMAQVFAIKGWRKGRCLYWPALLPYLSSSCKTALGMSWKSGIAAEVIGVPERTIGEQLYLSKIYLNTADLFAWTLVIILASAGFERLFLVLLNWIGNRKPFFFSVSKIQFRYSNFSHRAFIYGKTAAYKRIQITEKTRPFAPFTLSIINLSKNFGNLEIFHQQSFTFSSDKPCCIMAASGFGKTTLFRILLGLEPADDGEILLDRKALLSNFIPGKFSAVFQENRLCEGLSPVDNLLLAVPSLSRKEAENELSLLLPRECLNRPVSTLSGGMKRRVAIVRAVCFPSSILLMDEPFTGLDEETKQNTIAYILSRRQGRMLLFSSHQEEDAKKLGAEILLLSAVN